MVRGPRHFLCQQISIVGVIPNKRIGRVLLANPSFGMTTTKIFKSVTYYDLTMHSLICASARSICLMIIYDCITSMYILAWLTVMVTNCSPNILYNISLASFAGIIANSSICQQINHLIKQLDVAVSPPAFHWDPYLTFDPDPTWPLTLIFVFVFIFYSMLARSWARINFYPVISEWIIF